MARRGWLAMPFISKKLSIRKSLSSMRTTAKAAGGKHCMSRLASTVNYKYCDHRDYQEVQSMKGEVQPQHKEYSMYDDDDDDGEGKKEYKSSCWVPHPRSGIYYPKGQEWVMEDVPEDAACFAHTYWLRNSDHEGV